MLDLDTNDASERRRIVETDVRARLEPTATASIAALGAERWSA